MTSSSIVSSPRTKARLERRMLVAREAGPEQHLAKHLPLAADWQPIGRANPARGDRLFFPASSGGPRIRRGRIPRFYSSRSHFNMAGYGGTPHADARSPVAVNPAHSRIGTPIKRPAPKFSSIAAEPPRYPAA